MSFNWNVYKIFKSGKRAKAPVHSFNFEGTVEEVQDYFSSHEIKVLSEKIGKKINSLNYQILDSDAKQQPASLTEEEIFEKNKNRVMGALITQNNMPTDIKYVGGLIYSAESNWKWQWAALQVATSKYIRGLSPHFNSYKEAKTWMEKQIIVSSSSK